MKFLKGRWRIGALLAAAIIPAGLWAYGLPRFNNDPGLRLVVSLSARELKVIEDGIF